MSSIINIKPSIIHFNHSGWRKKKCKPLIKKLLLQLKKIEDHSYTNNLDILVCNNQKTKFMTEKSLDKLGCKYKKLGEGVNWVDNGLKIKLCYEYLKKCKKEYVLHLDGNDSILLDNPSIILEEFKKFEDTKTNPIMKDFFEKAKKFWKS